MAEERVFSLLPGAVAGREKELVLSSASKTGSSEKPPGIMLLEMEIRISLAPFFISSRQVSG